MSTADVTVERLGASLLAPVLVRAPLDRPSLRAALRGVVRQHDVLRGAGQGALPDGDVLFVDLTALDGPDRSAAVVLHAEQLQRCVPDASQEPVWAVVCLELAPDRFLLLMSLHPLAADEESLLVLAEDVRDGYLAELGGGGGAGETVRGYGDFVAWQTAYLEGRLGADRTFFAGLYADSPGPALLPGSGREARAFVTAHASERVSRVAGTGLWDGLRDAGVRAGVGPRVLLTAVYGQLVGRITGADAVTIGVLVDSRPSGGFAGSVGPFTSVFPLTVRTGHRGVAEAVRQCGRVIRAIERRSAYPPADLVEHVPAFAGLPRSTYFTDPHISVTVHLNPEDDLVPVEVLRAPAALRAYGLEGLDPPVRQEVAGLLLAVDLWQDELRFDFWYHRDRFSPAQVEAWAATYLAQLSATVDALM